jgi:RNA polymerase sigma-70 factor (ECF subfamily)
MPASDASLVRASANGRPAAFGDLLRRHDQAVHAYLARRAGREAADDLLGEVWVRAYAARSRYDQRCSDARPWLYGIARNVLREHWRSVSGCRADGDALAHLAVPEDPWPDVDARIDAAARLTDLRRALAALPSGDREVLLLVTWESLTPAEAATVLGIPPGTARSRLHRARAQMRSHLAEHPPVHSGTGYQEA